MAYADHRKTASKLACTVMRLTVRRFARRTQIAPIRELAGRAALAIISLEVLDRACGVLAVLIIAPRTAQGAHGRGLSMVKAFSTAVLRSPRFHRLPLIQRLGIASTT